MTSFYYPLIAIGIVLLGAFIYSLAIAAGKEPPPWTDDDSTDSHSSHSSRPC